MSLWERLFIVFVRFFAACRSYTSPYFILTMPVDAIGYYLLWGNVSNGTSHAWHATESANRRVGAASNACAVGGVRAGSIEINGRAAVITYASTCLFAV